MVTKCSYYSFGAFSFPGFFVKWWEDDIFHKIMSNQISVVQDAVRLYLINSPVVRAEPLRFKKEGVYGVVSVIYLVMYYVLYVGVLFVNLCSLN